MYPMIITKFICLQNLKLPQRGGDVIVHYGKKNASVFFYTYRGLIDNFSGFIYAPNDVKPNEDDFNSIFKDIKKIEKLVLCYISLRTQLFF